jgi:hypothetical protein
VAKVVRSSPFTPARVALWSFVFLIGVLGGYFIYRAVEDQPSSSASPPPPVVAKELTIVGASDYDPEGTGGENPEEVGAVWDKNVATVWKTEEYRDRDVGGLKSGVGFVVDLGAPKNVERLEVTSPDRDWSAQVYASDSVPEAIDGWGPPRFTGQGLGTDSKMVLTPGARARNVLLWITDLPPGNPFQLRVAEVRVFGTA